MRCCASCGSNQDLRLYEGQDGDHANRRWWCLECSFSARHLGVTAGLSPAWIERAALHGLPMKPYERPRTDFSMMRTGRRSGDIRAR